MPKLNHEQRQKVYLGMVRRFGKDQQIIQTMEECGELIASLSHLRRKKCQQGQVTEEMIDVMIMLNQMLYVFDISVEEFQKQYDEKLHNIFLKYDLRREGYYSDERFQDKET